MRKCVFQFCWRYHKKISPYNSLLYETIRYQGGSVKSYFVLVGWISMLLTIPYSAKKCALRRIIRKRANISIAPFCHEWKRVNCCAGCLWFEVAQARRHFERVIFYCLLRAVCRAISMYCFPPCCIRSRVDNNLDVSISIFKWFQLRFLWDVHMFRRRFMREPLN